MPFRVPAASAIDTCQESKSKELPGTSDSREAEKTAWFVSRRLFRIHVKKP